MISRFKGLDLVDRVLKNYGQRFATLYRRQWLKPSQRKRNARKQSGCLRGLPKQLRKEEKWKAREKGKDTPYWLQSSREQRGEKRKKVKVKVTPPCPTLCDPMDCPWDSPGQNTGVGSLSLLQRIFPTQGSNPGLQHCRWILYQLSYQGSLIDKKAFLNQQCK